MMHTIGIDLASMVNGLAATRTKTARETTSVVRMERAPETEGVELEQRALKVMGEAQLVLLPGAVMAPKRAEATDDELMSLI